jgi:hypothetical protein
MIVEFYVTPSGLQGKAFNPAAFIPAPSGEQGDLGRNVLRGFGAWQADLGLQLRLQLPKTQRFFFEPSSSTSSTIQTSAIRSTP